METQLRAISGQLRGKAATDGEKVFTFVASTSDPDRHRTVLNQDNWKLENFIANPIIGYQHNVYGDGCSDPHPDDVIGKAVKVYKEEGDLLIDVVFDKENEKAVKIESKVDRGFLNTVSVGFIEVGDGHQGNEDDGEDKELYYFHGQELLELSVVNIPSNPKAAKRSFRSQTFDALRFIYRELGEKYRFADIEDMKVRQFFHSQRREVRDVIDLLDKKETEEKTGHDIGEFSLRIAKQKYSALAGGH